MTPPRLLLLETSSQPGLVGLAEGPQLLNQHRLESGRNHARDLAPAVTSLLTQQNWQPNQFSAVIVGRGPGSYTGLRVGIMSAKTIAYVTRCALYAIDSFAVLAQQMPSDCLQVEVIADAQKDAIYTQRFEQLNTHWHPLDALRIMPITEWLTSRDPKFWLTGPGLIKYGLRLPENAMKASSDLWAPRLDSLLQVALTQMQDRPPDDFFAIEPIYLQESSAELQWRAKTSPDKP